ncbi:MAG TPA: deaminase [Candidatus Nanoarchaeia archaeon]|nr:deaminase [Candidatus Nanoarchaeia archaeon]
MDSLSLKNLSLQLVEMAAKFSDCYKRKVGAAIVPASYNYHCLNPNRVYFGFNQAPNESQKCIECPRMDAAPGKKDHLCHIIHAEAMAIMQALYKTGELGDTLGDWEMMVTLFPCSYCCSLIVMAKVKKLYYIEDYYDEKKQNYLKNYLESSGVKVVKIDSPERL